MISVTILTKDSVRQLPSVLDADEKVRDGLRIKATLAHGLGDVGEVAAGLLGDGFTGDAGPELVRSVKYCVEDLEAARLVKGRQVELVYPGGRVVEVSVDADDVHVAHDQQRRVVEVGAVFEKLVIGGAEVFVPALVFPAEEVLLPNVGPAVAAALFGGAALEGEPLALRIGVLRLGVADQLAEIEEMRLRGGALREVNLAPLGDKSFGGHARADGAAGRLVSAASRTGLGLNVGTARLYTSGAAASCSLVAALPSRA